MLETNEQLVLFIVGEFYTSDDEITPASRLHEDLNFDVLDLIEIGVAIEDQFEEQLTIELDDEIVDGWQTVGDIIDFVNKS